MNLVDTSGWLEYLADTKNAKNFAEAIENTDELIVSSINIYETYKKVLKERDEDAAIQIIGLMKQSKVFDVTSTIAVKAAKLSYEKDIPMAGSIIYITAKENDAIVWTQDADLKGLEVVKYFNKK